MSNIVFIHKKNDKIKFNQFSKKIISSGTRSYCLSKIKKDFLVESIESADYLFVNTFREQIRGFAAVYHDNYDGKHLHISLICNSKTHRMATRKNKNIPKLAGKNIIEAVLKYGKQINVKDVRLDAIKEVIPYYYNLGFRFENSQNNTDTEKTLVKELQKAQTNNNKPTQKKALEKIVLKFYKGYFNEKMQHDMGKDTDERIKYAMDFGIPMKFVFKTTSICKGKTIKNPNRCRKYKTCKVVHGKKRSYCRTIKNTRKKQKGGKDKLFPHVIKHAQNSLHKSIDKLFVREVQTTRKYDTRYSYRLNVLDNDDYNDLVSLFKEGIKVLGTTVKPSPIHNYKDFKEIQRSPKYNIVQLLIMQNRDFTDFLEYLADNHPELFELNHSIRTLYTASEYLSPITEKLIEILQKNGNLNQSINTGSDSPFLRLLHNDHSLNKIIGKKKSNQPRIIELMKLFIEKGANIHDIDSTDSNALMLASGQGCEQVVSYLLSINLNINGFQPRLRYITPLYLAIINKHRDVVEILIKHKDPNNSISIEELELQTSHRDRTSGEIYDLLVKEIKNRKKETLKKVVEKKTGKDGKLVTDNIFSFVDNPDTVYKAHYGGTKKELGEAHKDRIKVVWKGKDRQIYTYPTDVYIPDSQEEEEKDITSLEQFTERDSFEKLEKALVHGITHLFVIIYDEKGAVMRLGDQEHSHSQLSGDKGNNYIIAAGEIRWDKGENTLKISNQSGHYEPDSKDVKDVTIDFFAGRIDIDFYKPFKDVSESESSQSQSPQSPLDMGRTEPDDGVYRVPKGGRKTRKNRK
jgi:hypothetical protein